MLDGYWSTSRDRTEYEWYETIRAEHLPSVVAGLGGRPGQDVLDLLEQCCVEPRTDRLREVLEERQIPVERWIRVGD
jgi:hypothetical protein